MKPGAVYLQMCRKKAEIFRGQGREVDELICLKDLFWGYSSHFLSLLLALSYSTLTPPLFCVKLQLPSRDGRFLRLACLLMIRLTLVLFSRSECISFWDPPRSRYSLSQRKQRQNECSCCMSHVLSLHSDKLGWSHIAGNREVQRGPCSLFCCWIPSVYRKLSRQEIKDKHLLWFLNHNILNNSD